LGEEEAKKLRKKHGKAKKHACKKPKWPPSV